LNQVLALPAASVVLGFSWQQDLEPHLAMRRPAESAPFWDARIGETLRLVDKTHIE
jgi:hypothetical protein